MTPHHSLPYGLPDLDPEPYLDPGPPRRVRCYVRGCGQMLRPAREVCPVHGIRCHHSRYGFTYSFEDVRRNLIVDADLVAGRIVGHPFKFESDRLGLENSEDALTWNVFRSLQKAGLLHEVACMITGQEIAEEPVLYLWGLCLTEDSLEPWPLLIAARERFESCLPVSRPLTEPDIGLYLPGRYLILVEAKFSSGNPFYEDGPRRDATSLTKEELLSIYYDDALNILDVERGRQAERVPYQLWRNLVFAEWMAMADGHATPAYHANLTRTGYEEDSCSEFRRMVGHSFKNRFVHLAWEDIHSLVVERSELSLLERYLGGKTTGLIQAFRIAQRTSPKRDA